MMDNLRPALQAARDVLARFGHIEAVAGCDDALSQSGASWIDANERNPDDEQKVIGWWAYEGGCMESLTYRAEDAPDGPATWTDVHGEKTDPPDFWMPYEALVGPV